jgi:TonB family protein
MVSGVPASGSLVVLHAAVLCQDPAAGAGGDAASAAGDARIKVKACAVGDKGCTTSVRAVYAPAPAYTRAARKAKVKGVVTMSVTVNTKGLAQDVTLDEKLGYGLDEKAVKAVKEWKFRPATRDGVPVPVRLVIRVNFNLY